MLPTALNPPTLSSSSSSATSPRLNINLSQRSSKRHIQSPAISLHHTTTTISNSMYSSGNGSIGNNGSSSSHHSNLPPHPGAGLTSGGLGNSSRLSGGGIKTFLRRLSRWPQMVSFTLMRGPQLPPWCSSPPLARTLNWQGGLCCTCASHRGECEYSVVKAESSLMLTLVPSYRNVYYHKRKWSGYDMS